MLESQGAPARELAGHASQLAAAMERRLPEYHPARAHMLSREAGYRQAAGDAADARRLRSTAAALLTVAYGEDHVAVKELRSTAA